jgi:hypothetical protein
VVTRAHHDHPTQRVADGEQLGFGDVEFRVQNLGPGESLHDNVRCDEVRCGFLGIGLLGSDAPASPWSSTATRRA